MIDASLKKIINQEYLRQKNGIELIPSENYASRAVRSCLSTVLTNKYSEGYAGKRYYGGNKFIDDVERLAITRAKKLFKVPHVNVQPYSGSPANFAVYMAVCNPNDTIMGLNLLDGGHLTHGWKVSATSMFYNSIPYHVDINGKIDFKELEMLVKKHRPRLIWAGATAYVYKYDYKRFAELADSVGAYLAVDIAHVAGLIVGGVHPSPVKYAHIVTTTTHKTLRGPRGGMIMVTDKGIQKDPELSVKIDKAIFPGLQGGPHNHQTAAIAQALYEAEKPEFKEYAQQIIINAHTLAKTLQDNGLQLVGHGTENHMMLIDLTKTHGIGMGLFAEYALDTAGMTTNKNTIPQEPMSPFYPSGIRLGTPAATTRGLKEKEIQFIGEKIMVVLDEVKKYEMPQEKEVRLMTIPKILREISRNKRIKTVRKEIQQMMKYFPIP